MSNFTCPTCGLTNIDCGKAGYKTAREIELEKKLEIAIKALKEIARDKTTEEQQGNPDYVDEDGDLIGDFEYAYDEFIKIARKALNGESEER